MVFFDIMAKDLAIDVGIPINTKEFDKFVNCVDNILTYGCKYIDQTTDDILEKCNQSKLPIAAKIIKECRRIVNNTSRIRPTRLKWWEIYHNNKCGDVPYCHVDIRTRDGRDDRTRDKRKRPMSPLFDRRRKRPMSPLFDQRPMSPLFDRRRKRPMSPLFDRRRKRPMSPLFGQRYTQQRDLPNRREERHVEERYTKKRKYR